MMHALIQRGDRGSRPPPPPTHTHTPGKSQVIWISMGNKQFDRLILKPNRERGKRTELYLFPCFFFLFLYADEGYE